VPSPEPLEIVEIEVIRDLVERNVLVIACGGGGIPVMWKGDQLTGVEAVIDKDRASALLAALLSVDFFVISTDTDFVYVDYKKPAQRALREVHTDELQSYLNAGHFPPGNMGPKIESVLRFLKNGGREAIITSCDNLQQAVAGQAGTHVLPAERSVQVDVEFDSHVPMGGR
jgi:carbamate kinase